MVNPNKFGQKGRGVYAIRASMFQIKSQLPLILSSNNLLTVGFLQSQSISLTEELASLFGLAVTIFIGKDDKAQVPIGKTAANKQAPFFVNVKYKAHLPDHDFVAATKHMLTLPVIGLHETLNTPKADRKSVRYFSS